MFESTRTSIGLRIARWRFRKIKDPVISFTSALSEAGSVLVAMPFGEADTGPMIPIIRLLQDRVGEENITVVTSDHAVEIVRLLPRGQFIQVLDSELSPFYLPRPLLVERVTRKPFDIAIDLSLDLVLPPAYIVRASNARVRVGFTKRLADVFYNLQIQPDTTLSRKLIYDRMVKCLEMF